MTFDEAIALQPAWVGLWLNVLFFGAYILPIALLVWRQSRVAGVISIALSLAGGAATYWLYGKLGYVRLLGLPHIIVWTPLVIYLITQFRRDDMPKWPKLIIGAIVTTMLISMAFDYADVIRYLLGETAPLV